MEELNSNNTKTTIHFVCSDCGERANKATCLKKYGVYPKKEAFSISTFHVGKCDFCGKKKDITQTRDFFYPDFNLIKMKTKKRKCWNCKWKGTIYELKEKKVCPNCGEKYLEKVK